MAVLRELKIRLRLDGDAQAELKRANAEIDRLKAKFEPVLKNLPPEIARTASGLAQATEQLKKHGDAWKRAGEHSQRTTTLMRGDLPGVETATKKVTSQIDKAKDSIKAASEQTSIWKMAMSGVAAFGIGAIGTVAIKDALSVGINFQAQMSQVAAATGKTGEPLRQLTQEARRLGAATTFSATEAAQAMTELGKAGMTVEQIMVGTNAVLDLAGAGQLGLAEATTIAADTMSGFGLKADDMGRISDVLSKGANASTISVQMMGETFKYVSGVAKAANVSLEETAAMTAILGNAGIKGSMAGTTLKAMLLELADSKKINIMKGIGVDPTENGKLRSIADIMGDLQNKMKNMGNQQKLDLLSKMFGSEPAAGIIALIDQGRDGISKMTEEMKKAGGSAKEFARIANDNIKGMMKIISSMYEETQLKIFDVLDILISPILRFFTDGEKGAIRFNFALGLLATIIGVGLVFAAKSAMIAGYAMLTPYLPIIGIVAGISAGLMALYLVFEDIYIFLEYGPEGSETFFGDMLKWIGLTDEEMQGLSDKFKEFKDVMSDAWERLKSFADSDTGKTFLKIAGIIALIVVAVALWPVVMIAAFAVMAAYIIAKWDDIKAGFWSMLEFMKKAAIIAGKVLLSVIFPIAGLYIFRNEIKAFFEYLWNLFKSTDFGKMLIDQFVNLKNSLSNALSGMWESVKGTMNSLLPTETINNVIDMINLAMNKLSEFSKSTLLIPDFTWADIPRIQARAAGGPVNAGSPYLVGEKGPELIIPGNSGNVIPNNKLNQYQSVPRGSSSQVINATINVFGNNAQELAYDLWSQLQQLMKDNENSVRVELGMEPVYG